MKYTEEDYKTFIEHHDKQAEYYRSLLKELRKKHRVLRFARFAGQLLGLSVVLLLGSLVVWMAVAIIRMVL